MLTDIRLQNFRSYDDASFEFGQGVNIVVGPNASGKTNLLEAILVLASGSSFRARDSELLSFDAPWGRLDGFFGAQSRVLKMVKAGAAINKEFMVDGKSYKRLGLERT